MLEGKYDIVEAENGAEAISVMEKLGSDLVLVVLDIVKTDGFEVLSAMNSYGWISDMPVIMILPEVLPTYIERAYDMGVTDYINFPFDTLAVRRRVQNIIAVYSKQRRLVNLVAEQVYERERDNGLLVEILSNIVEFRNGERALHVLNMRTLTELLLTKLMEKTNKYGLTASDILIIGSASSLHDIGKIVIPQDILNKPGKLTDEEFEIMKAHCAKGAELLERLPLRSSEPLVERAHEICMWHHERYDGKGYPQGLSGDQIAISAQVVALADVYDALTSKRVYKDAIPHSDAVDMILSGKCGEFDPLLLECFSEIACTLEQELRKNSCGHTSQFDPEMSASDLAAEEVARESASAASMIENERTKYRFFASISKEMQFEYTVFPDVLTISERAAKYLGVSETLIAPFSGDELFTVISKKDVNNLLKLIDKATQQSPVVEYSCDFKVKGQSRYTKIIARTMWSPSNGSLTGIIGRVVDLHEELVRLEKLEKLEKIASEDALTGLYNHPSARRFIESILEGGCEGNCLMAVIDLDFFKQANDLRGHLFGDGVLKYVSDKIKNNTRKSDIAARIGGDEFLVFMETGSGSVVQISRVFESILGNYKNFNISASMGVAVLGAGQHVSYDNLFKCADAALYAAKRDGRGRMCVYDYKTYSPGENDGRQDTRGI